MQVKDRMTVNPYTTSPDASVLEAWSLMQEHGLLRLPVLDQQDLVGIITTRDFGACPGLDLRGKSLDPCYSAPEQEDLLNKVKVRDLIPVDQSLVTIEPEAYIELAAKLLRVNNISGLPVVDDAGKLVGIITRTDIFNTFLDLLAIDRKGSRIDLRGNDNPETLITIGQILGKYKVRIENLVTMEVKGEDHLIILRINTIDSEPIVNDFKAAGLKVESVLVKQ